MYCFVNWRETSDHKEPDLPEGLGYLVLAEPYQDSDYVLLQISYADEYQPAMPVSDELEDLLGAAEQYAPALAITRETISSEELIDQQAFERLLIERLRHLLGGQRDHSYFLVEALRTELGYKYAGTYYWVVGYHPNRAGREIDWVSRDFFIYQGGLAEFRVEVADLEQRFTRR